MTVLIASPVLDRDQHHHCQNGSVTLLLAITHPNKRQHLLLPILRDRNSVEPE